MHQAVFLARSAMSSADWLVCTTCHDYGLVITNMKGGDRMSYKCSGLTGRIEELTLAIQVRH